MQRIETPLPFPVYDYTDWPSEWMWPHIMNVLLINKDHLAAHPGVTVMVPLVPGDDDGYCDHCLTLPDRRVGFLLTLGRVRFIAMLCPACLDEEWDR